jgi:hypothetical protein
VIYGLFFRRYAPFATFGGGFEGDNRKSATTSLTATSRTTGALNFAPGNVGNMTAESSGTTYAGLGVQVQQLLGRHFSKVTSSVSVATRTIDCLRFTAQTAGANPMVPASPTIDTFLDVHIVFRNQAIELAGRLRGDNFPNAEVFATDAIGQSSLLFEFATSGGQLTGPMTRLAGDNSSQVLGSFSRRIALRPGGTFA